MLNKMTNEKVYIEIDGEVIFLYPGYDMEDVVRWANSDYSKED